MKRHHLTLVILLLTSPLLTPEIVAAELHKDWLKHLAGVWSSKDSMGTTGESKADLRLDGNLVVSKGKNSLGLEVMTVTAWEPDKQALVMTSYDNSGMYFRIIFNKITATSITGAQTGQAEGLGTYTGQMTLTKTAKGYQWTGKFKTANGEQAEVQGTSTRKK
ncbi:MAG: hypothetical protein CMJ75_12065 [Planctomycetaceae bacterium]|nr:hypothetical protein [Planctomycetaceae bacterium]